MEGEKGVMAVAKTTVLAETPALKFLLAMKRARWEMNRVVFTLQEELKEALGGLIRALGFLPFLQTHHT